jgi:regulator of replication initiation timing
MTPKTMNEQIEEIEKERKELLKEQRKYRVELSKLKEQSGEEKGKQ